VWGRPRQSVQGIEVPAAVKNGCGLAGLGAQGALVEGYEVYLWEAPKGGSRSRRKVPYGGPLKRLEAGESWVLDGPRQAVGVHASGEAKHLIH
jgi:hypothetical protein